MSGYMDFIDVSKHYDSGGERVAALDGVSVSIDRGQFVAIVGASGSGKSTMMNIMGGLDRPTSGRYLFRGRDLSCAPDRVMSRYRSRMIGFIFQSFNLDPSLTALENVALPMVYAGVNRAERLPRARAALESVGLGDRLTHTPPRLSGGQMQRVCIARAMVNRPQIILADEPTGNLDRAAGETVMQLLADSAARGFTVLMVTHNAAQAEYAGRVLEICDGRIVRDSSK